MADGSKIEWTDATWNPITGCSVVSPGCTNCYAMRLAGTRLAHIPSRAGLTRDSKAGPVWTGEVRLNESWLDQPLRWRDPRMIFVCAHGDLFHESVPDEWIDRVFAVMALAPRHTFQVLTKRSARMRAYLSGPLVFNAAWPLPNVWLGVSAEDQARANERIPDLLNVPAAVRWISAEPLLGSIDLTTIPLGGDQVGNALTGVLKWIDGTYRDEGMARLDWVVAGGESGSGARPMKPDWARGLRDQCAQAGIAFHFKQWGGWVSELQSPEDAILPSSSREFWPDAPPMYHVGKKKAGRTLDGVTHDGFPATAAAL